jgi:hypothetical protein
VHSKFVSFFSLMTLFHLTTRRMHPKKSLTLFQSLHRQKAYGILKCEYIIRPCIDCELRVSHPILCTILCANKDTKIDQDNIYIYIYIYMYYVSSLWSHYYHFGALTLSNRHHSFEFSRRVTY